MAKAQYKDLTINDFKGYAKVPSAKRSWAVKLIEDFLAQSKDAVIGIEFETEEETRSRQLAINKALRDNDDLNGKAKVCKRGNALYIERVGAKGTRGKSKNDAE